ncbi:MAG: SUMF1/EgtB/PvdO family nonheme iron enzyme [Candidatus Zixiibacteriota bacterium]|nr:MAG: SUMF1/EgtB/PvdO family nonheme iron enzyme [candidate division Zixibacteria bacterium]
MIEGNFGVSGKMLFLLPLFILAVSAACSRDKGDIAPANMVLVKGGTFMMGDVFGEGEENEIPVHQVTLADFYIGRYEVTVGEFKKFVQEIGYKTSAEGPIDPEAQRRIMAQAGERKPTRQELLKLKRQYLKYGGAGFWDAEKREWTGYDTLINWRNPGFEQTDADPVMAVSPDDAMQYCNWLSAAAGLPIAYDLETGWLMDHKGRRTMDITRVKGYRLPSEAEWEYAAREGGREVRFGSGKNIAKSSEINFRGDEGEYSYLETGGYLKKSTPVGSYPPNSLGLYDMSGNAWEWTGDRYVKYTIEVQENPYTMEGEGHALRGGRWGGDAYEARVFHRSSWVRNDRCNNSGFRIARSK